MTVLAFVATAILVPMLVTELTAWLPWLASRVISAAARLMPPAYRARYAEEWQAELDALPGGDLAKLVFAVRIWVGVPGTRGALGGIRRARSWSLKSAFDKLLALAGLVLAAPLLALLALIIRLDDGGPALFRQTRVGQDGRHFPVYKFRTMAIDAEVQSSTSTGTPGIWLHRDGWPCDPDARDTFRAELHAVMDRVAAQRDAAQ